MKNQDKNFKNYIEDDWNGCCGGVMVGADGSIDEVERDLGAKAKKLAYGVVLLVGIVVTSTWVYGRFVKK